MTIIVNCKLHLCVCGRLIARDWIHIYAFTVCTVICWLTTSLCYRGKDITAYHKENNVGQSPQGKLYMQCCRSYSAVLYTSWRSCLMGQSRRKSINSCDAAWKESFSVLSSLCCDVITRCIQKAHLCTWLEITSISTLRKMLNGVKEWGVEWEERHQLPLVGRKPLLQTITYVGNSSPIWPSLVRGWDPCRE